MAPEQPAPAAEHGDVYKVAAFNDRVVFHIMQLLQGPPLHGENDVTGDDADERVASDDDSDAADGDASPAAGDAGDPARAGATTDGGAAVDGVAV